jgi:hypothetical protein
MIEQTTNAIPLWVQFFLAVLGSGSLAAVVHLVRDQLRRRAARLYDRGYSDISEIYRLIQELLSNIPGANRVVVLKSENGGGIPAPGCVVKSSILYEVCDSPAKPMFEAWQVVPLDQDYSSILAKLSTDGRSVIRRSDLHRDSITHDLFKAANATHAYLFRICATAHALLYLSVQYSSPDDDAMDSAAHAATRGLLRQTGKIFARHHQLVKRESQQ